MLFRKVSEKKQTPDETLGIQNFLWDAIHVRKAYRKLAREHYLKDENASPEAIADFKRITDAYNKITQSCIYQTDRERERRKDARRKSDGFPPAKKSLDPKNNPYRILGLSANGSNVTQEDIKKAYRKLALKFHPDKNANSNESEATFKRVSAAYQTLTNPTSKGIIDNVIERGCYDNYEYPVLTSIYEEYISKWPEADRKIALEYMQHNTRQIEESIVYYLGNNKLSYKEFESPLHPIYWEVLNGESVIQKEFSTIKDIIHRFNQSKNTKFIIENNLLPVRDHYHFFLSDWRYDVWDLPRKTIYLDDLKWLLIQELTDLGKHGYNNFVDTEGESPLEGILIYGIIYNLFNIKNPLSLDYLASLKKNHAPETKIPYDGIYEQLREEASKVYDIERVTPLLKIHELLVFPTQNKINELKAKGDKHSIEKAKQLEFMLKKVGDKLKKEIPRIIFSKKFFGTHPTLHYERDRDAINPDLEHRIEIFKVVIDILKPFVWDQKINKRKNLICDFVKVILGACITTLSLGTALLSEKFRHTFFHTKTSSFIVDTEYRIESVLNTLVAHRKPRLKATTRSWF